MTKAGDKWAKDVLLKNQGFVPDDEIELEEAFEPIEMTLRAFYDEVERRAATKNVERKDTQIELAFRELKRELLGEESK